LFHPLNFLAVSVKIINRPRILIKIRSIQKLK
jgi:hypothetical protein